MTIFADTPDEQFGIVTAEQLLATVNNPTQTATVTLKPNTESIIIVFSGGDTQQLPTVKGVTTNSFYNVTGYLFTTTGYAYYGFVCSVSFAADEQVLVTLPDVVSHPWYVIGDAAVRQTVDLTIAALAAYAGNPIGQPGLVAMGSDGALLRDLQTDKSGVLRVISEPPGSVSGSEPLNELQATYLSAVTPMAALGVGKRYRLFAIYPLVATGGSWGNVNCIPINQGTLGAYFTFGYVGTNGMHEHITFPLSGLAMLANTGVSWSDGAGVNGCTVIYTIENV